MNPLLKNREMGQEHPDMAIDELETGTTAKIIVSATWKACAHGGGWWVAKDADGREVLLAPDGFADRLLRVAEEVLDYMDDGAKVHIPDFRKFTADALAKARGQ